MGPMQKIPLPRGKFTLVDDCDYAELSKFKWNLNQHDGNGYVRRVENGTRRIIFLHKVILGAGSGQEVDHRNRNRLDNRRENLRLATHGQNAKNRKRQTNNTSGVAGVSPQDGGWLAQIKCDGALIRLGFFRSKEAAIEARKRAQVMHKEFSPDHPESSSSIPTYFAKSRFAPQV